MAKEWILNRAMNRFKLNSKKSVGAVSEQIRLCRPKTIGQWRKYYLKKVKPKIHIESLGKKLYIKIRKEIKSEIQSITKNDCIDYMFEIVIDKTFDGYQTEIEMIKQLSPQLGVEVKESSDEWDRYYSVDFFIKVKKYYIGLQIKPISQAPPTTEIYKEREIEMENHQRFTEKFKGRVFYIYSKKSKKKKIIADPEVIEEISNEIQRLKSL